jgi:hypothetical protein
MTTTPSNVMLFVPLDGPAVDVADGTVTRSRFRVEGVSPEPPRAASDASAHVPA